MREEGVCARSAVTAACFFCLALRGSVPVPQVPLARLCPRVTASPAVIRTQPLGIG